VAASERPKNLVGPQLARLRNEAGLSQMQFAAKCQRMGWDISRGVVAAIEGGVRCVTDREFVNLARVLGVPLKTLLPYSAQRLLR
jgi:transcriptional regulator with XRE-family HTH domain